MTIIIIALITKVIILLHRVCSYASYRAVVDVEVMRRNAKTRTGNALDEQKLHGYRS